MAESSLANLFTQDIFLNNRWWGSETSVSWFLFVYQILTLNWNLIEKNLYLYLYLFVHTNRVSLVQISLYRFGTLLLNYTGSLLLKYTLVPCCSTTLVAYCSSTVRFGSLLLNYTLVPCCSTTLVACCSSTLWYLVAQLHWWLVAEVHFGSLLLNYTTATSLYLRTYL